MTEKHHKDMQEAVMSMMTFYVGHIKESIDGSQSQYLETDIHKSTTQYAELFYAVFGEIVGLQRQPTLFTVKHLKLITDLAKLVKQHLMSTGHLPTIVRNRESALVFARIFLGQALQYANKKQVERSESGEYPSSRRTLMHV